MDGHDTGSIVVETSDFDEIVSVLRSAFGRCEVRRGPEPIHLRLTQRTMPGLQIMRWSLGGECWGVLDRREVSEPAVLAGIRLAGAVDLRGESGALDTVRPYVCPDRLDSRVVSSDIVNASVGRHVLDEHASALLGIDDFEVAFTGTNPLDRARGEVWRDTLAFAAHGLLSVEQHPDMVLYRSALTDLVCAVLMQTFPNTTLDAVARGSSRTSAAVRRAQQFIDDNLTEPIGPPQIAAAARMSLRGLHAAFRRQLDTTPMAYVKRARLAAARAEMLDSDPASTDLAEVAMRWGFVSYPQFARLFAEQYGHAPDDATHR